MSDAPPPPASELPPTAGSKRPWTILGRLSKAVREQNWFAVVLELAIVVLGVVIGFQVTAWGQAQSDRAKEQAYLHQLVADLNESEATMRRSDVFAGESERAAGRLLASFDSPERPSPDTLYRWIGLSRWVEAPRPVLGTAQALVSTGDLGLIQNEALRAAITSYLEVSNENIEFQRQVTTHSIGIAGQLAPLFDARAIGTLLPPDHQDILSRFGHPVLNAEMVTSGHRPTLDDVERFYSAPEARGYVAELAIMLVNLAHHRGTMHETAQALREQIEAELD